MCMGVGMGLGLGLGLGLCMGYGAWFMGHGPNDFDGRIYTISCKQDEYFKIQLRKEQFEDPIIHSAFKDVENENEILTDRLKRVGNQLRIENGILTKGRFYWPNMYKYIPIV